MHYFVTGATGFIGKRLVQQLLTRKGAVVHFLIRPESEGKVAALREYWGLSGRPPKRAQCRFSVTSPPKSWA
jgi:thioester reductase-like protein